MAAPKIVVVGGSAGGLEAVVTILQGLPRNLNAAVIVVLHTGPQSGQALPHILERAGALPARFPVDEEQIVQGQVYVAPPDRHLTLVSGRLCLDRGPRENGFRPAVDPLFRSAAKEFSQRAVGVILSGAMDDGTFGLMAIKEAGGVALVQHPYEALVPSMPLSAIQNVEVDHIVRAAEMPALLTAAASGGLTSNRMARTSDAELARRADPTGRDISLAGAQPDAVAGPPSNFVCPECGGTLWELSENGMSRYRCHTGHGFTLDTLLAAQNGNLESALWSGIRVLMERATLHRQLAERTAARGMTSTAERYQDRALHEEKQANLIRDMLAGLPAEEDIVAAVTDTIP